MADGSRLARAAYRVRQVLLGFRPALRAGEVAAVRALLNDEERALFTSMDARDRRHSVDMLLWLRDRTAPSPTLEVAALLHDVGKGRLRLHERVAFVLLGVVLPRWRSRLGTPEARGLAGGARRALWRLEHHGALGAERLRRCSSARVCWLVEHHTDAVAPPTDKELQWLIAADDAC